MSTAFFGMYKNKNNYKKGQNQCDIVDLRLYVEAASERLTRQSLQQYNCFEIPSICVLYFVLLRYTLYVGTKAQTIPTYPIIYIFITNEKNMSL